MDIPANFKKSWSKTVSSMSTKDGCWYCGKNADTWDHIVSRHKNGTGEIENLVPCCRSCNSKKGKKSLADFRKALRLQGIRSDFDTPEPFPITGNVYHSYRRNGFPDKSLFISDDEKLIDYEWIERVYLNEH